MEYLIPLPEDRITLTHDSGLVGDAAEAQAEAQRDKIIEFARAIHNENRHERYVAVEVWYQSSGPDDFDAVQVDLSNNTIVGTLPPYDEVDPDWKAKREALT